jgi:hypothetical protein
MPLVLYLANIQSGLVVGSSPRPGARALVHCTKPKLSPEVYEKRVFHADFGPKNSQ